MIKFIIVILPAIFQAIDSTVVRCDHTTEVCDCGTPSDGICEFSMEIQHLLTFTRYEVAADGTSRGTAARVWYINETTGIFQPHPDPMTEDFGRRVCYNETTDNCTEPFAVDGYTFRSFIGVNGRIPGPTLIVNKNNFVVVNVSNQLASETISIHWHGMHQRNSSWMDGVEHVTQCGIQPGANFTYVFQAEQSGTHWYHSHSGAQRTEGLFGALIIREDEVRVSMVKNIVGEFEDRPNQHTLTFLDWQYENSIDLFTQIHSSVRFFDSMRAPTKNVRTLPATYSLDGSEIGPVTYWSGLINGRGRHKDVSYNTSRLSIFRVEPNQVYRFRLIGAQSLYAYRVSFDEHKLTVIATDGAFIEPVEVDYIIIHSGERYDFLLKTKSSETAKENYIIRAETLEAYNSINPLNPISPNTVEAILHYGQDDDLPTSVEYEGISLSSIPVEMNCAEMNKCRALNCPFENYPPSYNINCTQIHELQTMFPPSAEDISDDVDGAQELIINFGFEGIRQTSAINARNLRLPSTPLTQLIADSDELSRINETEFCKGIYDSDVCDDDNVVVSNECRCTHVRTLEGDGLVQLVITAVAPNKEKIGNARATHPVHLHGHYFHVVDIQYGKYESTGALTELNSDIDCGGKNLCTTPTWANRRSYTKDDIINAPLKDTVIVPFGGYVVAYFTSDNPGFWFLHCHIEVHQLEGMGLIIAENINEAVPPPEGIQTCGNFDFNVDMFKDARAAGVSSTYNIVFRYLSVLCVLTVLLLLA